MSLKKYLKRNLFRNVSQNQPFSMTGQIIVEYVILFCLLALLTIIGASTFFAKLQHTTNSFSDAAIDSMRPE